MKSLVLNTSFSLFKRIMLRNYEVYALKVLALSIALATSIAITLFSLNELGYDRFHKVADNVFRVIQKNTDENYNGNRLSAKIAPEFFNTLKNQYADSLLISRVKIMDRVTIIVNNHKVSDQKIHAVDTTIDHILSLNIIDGDIRNFKTQCETSIIVSSQFAESNWGTIEVAGKRLMLYAFEDTVQVSITAVFKSFPENSHEKFDVLLSFRSTTIESLNFNPYESGVYGRTLVNKPAHYEFPDNAKTRFMLQPITQIYFGSRILGEAAKHGDRYSVIILVSITSLIFFLAISTFVNLTTLTLPYRSKELAVKKLGGATRESLILGFIKELCLLVSISLLVSLVILLGIHRFIDSLLGFDVMQRVAHPDGTFSLTVVLLFFTLVVSPVFMTIRFIEATPKRLLSSDVITFPALKRYITFTQLGISIFLIIASVVVRRQVNYSLVKEPGQNHDQIVYLHAPAGITNGGINSLRNDWRKYNPNILAVMAVSQLPDRVSSKEVDSDFYQLAVDTGFRDFFNLRMEEGHWFDLNSSDSSIIINKIAKGKLHENREPVLGVMEDINGFFNQPQKPIKIKRGGDYGYNWLCIRVLEVDIRRTVQKLSEQFSTSTGKASIHYLSSHFQAWIDYQDRLNKLSGILAVVAAILSGCAIYALSISLVRDKLKQVALRRLFGASTFNIAMLLILDFARQLGIATIIFLPISYLLLNELLRSFVYATHLSWLDPLYPLAYCVVVIIAICAFQAWNLRRLNSSIALKG